MSADRFGTPIQNALLLGLRQRALDKLLPHLQQVPLTLKDALERSGDRLQHAYFPQSGMISITVPLEDGRPVEVGTIGKEGMLGTSILLGSRMATPVFESRLAYMRRASISKSPRLRPAMVVTASTNAAPAGLSSPGTARLEAAACECSRAIQAQEARLLN